MATQVLTDIKTYLAGYDVSGDLNAAAIEYGAEMLDATAFGATTRTKKAGLRHFGLNMRGFWNGGTDLQDEVMFARVGSADEVLTMSPDGADDGEQAYFTTLIASQYEPGAEVGQMLEFQLQAQGRAQLVRGLIGKRGTISATGAGTAYQLGAVSATQRIWASAHIIGTPAGSSPTLDVIVQSDNAEGMGSPTTRLTFSQFTARGAQLISAAGAITDDWFRFSWTLGGSSSPSFAAVLAFGIF